jgi:hypothetical protein
MRNAAEPPNLIARSGRCLPRRAPTATLPAPGYGTPCRFLVRELVPAQGPRVEQHAILAMIEIVPWLSAKPAQMSSGPAIRAAQHAGEDAVSDALHEVMNRDHRADGTVRLDNVFRYLVATA